MLLAAAAAGSAADAPLATLTIQDGDARLIRDAAVWRPAEGLRLVAGDIVETTPATRLVRLELADGHAIDLGPATRVQLAPQLRERGRAQPALYLLEGWVKLTQSATARADDPLLGSRMLDVQQLARDVVLAVRGDTGWAFAESGAVTLAERRGGQPAASVTLAPGQFFERRGFAKPLVAARPSAEFLQQVPRAFRDTLPLRAALFKTRQATAKRLAAITYEDVQSWLAAEPALRRGFVSRWRGAARDAAFRRALAEHLDAHPEWDRVLHPEKYRPKQPAKTPAPRY
jgi:hypothetical protein